MASEAIDALIETTAAKPSFVSVDGNQTTLRSLKDLIEAAKYLKGQEAGAAGSGALRFQKLVPPGTA